MAMAVAQQHRESSSGSISRHLDAGKYVRYTAEQVEALERVYSECPKPSSLRRQQLIRECPILSNIEPKQIKVWFQNRRYHFGKLGFHSFALFFFFFINPFLFCECNSLNFEPDVYIYGISESVAIYVL